MRTLIRCISRGPSAPYSARTIAIDLIGMSAHSYMGIKHCTPRTGTMEPASTMTTLIVPVTDQGVSYPIVTVTGEIAFLTL